VKIVGFKLPTNTTDVVLISGSINTALTPLAGAADSMGNACRPFNCHRIPAPVGSPDWIRLADLGPFIADRYHRGADHQRGYVISR
jgi:hypothetical protein